MTNFCNTSRGNFNLGRRTYQGFRVPGVAATPTDNPVFIPLGKWCQENNYSKDQARTLMKKGYLAVTKKKNRIFVLQLCELDE